MFEIKHLKNAKQGYFSHLYDTINYSYYSFYAGIIFLIHGLFPCIYTSRGSSIINNLNEIIIEKKNNLEKMIE
jgi:hypothetical protein